MIKYAFIKHGALIGAICFLAVLDAVAQNSSRPGKAIDSPMTVNTVDITPGANAVNIDASAQGRPVERPFKKKILATAFAINKLGQVADIDNMEQGFPIELLRKLDQTHQFLIRSSPNLLSFSNQLESPSLRLVKQVAAENDSQFVISGEIRNAGIRTENKYWGLWKTNKRHIEIEFSVFDGMSGALLAKHTVVKQAEDKAIVGLDKPFGSAVFYATTYGKAISEILDESAKLITKDLESHGVLAKILKIENGQIVIDAGRSSEILAGDLATVEVVNNELPTMGLHSMQSKPLEYGLPHASLGKIAIIQAQQLFSIGELSAEVKPDDVKVGDFVRFDNVMAN
jgi:hypothetical protein